MDNLDIDKYSDKQIDVKEKVEKSCVNISLKNVVSRRARILQYQCFIDLKSNKCLKVELLL